MAVFKMCKDMTCDLRKNEDPMISYILWRVLRRSSVFRVKRLFGRIIHIGFAIRTYLCIVSEDSLYIVFGVAQSDMLFKKMGYLRIQNRRRGDSPIGTEKQVSSSKRQVYFPDMARWGQAQNGRVEGVVLFF